jgi:hypothetical protein
LLIIVGWVLLIIVGRILLIIVCWVLLIIVGWVLLIIVGWGITGCLVFIVVIHRFIGSDIIFRLWVSGGGIGGSLIVGTITRSAVTAWRVTRSVVVVGRVTRSVVSACGVSRSAVIRRRVAVCHLAPSPLRAVWNWIISYILRICSLCQNSTFQSRFRNCCYSHCYSCLYKEWCKLDCYKWEAYKKGCYRSEDCKKWNKKKDKLECNSKDN